MNTHYFINKVCAPLFGSAEKSAPISWQRCFRSTSVLIGLFNKMLMSIFGKYSREYCIATYLFSKKVHHLIKTMGYLGSMLYLKQCHICLMVAYGDSPKLTELSCHVSLTGSGYPRIIPAFHRKKIRRKDEIADKLVKWYLSMFSVYRLIPVAKPISNATFRTMIEPCTMLPSVIELVGEIKSIASTLWQRYVPLIQTIPLNQGMVWKPVWSTLPNLSTWKKICLATPVEDRPKAFKKDIVTPFYAISYELGAYGSLIRYIHARGEQTSSGILWASRVRFAFDANNKIWSGLDLDYFESRIGPVLPIRENFHEGIQPHISGGRLSQVVQGGGKRRIFAIGNYVNQRLLRPLHDWLMKVLRLIPQDGTFNQLKPLDLLKGSQVAYSIDLTAATDRWPLVFMFEMICNLFDRDFASATVNSALGLNIFDIAFVKKKPMSLAFVCGQPLGYFSSWPLFALSHHLLVWFAAEQCYPGTRFKGYAILGDDVVITDTAVASVYRSLLDRIGVKISYQKSLSSSTGAAEFAKKFRVKNLGKDLSPRSSKLFCAVHTTVGILSVMRAYALDYKTSLRVAGAGYRQMAQFRFKRSKKLDRIYILHTATQYPNLSFVLGRGSPLNPYLLGFVLSKLIHRMKPKELKLPPVSLYSLTPKEADFGEYSLTRNWLEDWLTYLKWYHEIKLYRVVHIEDVMDAPILQFSWRVNRSEEIWKRFGFLWKLYDIVGSMGLQWRPPILDVPDNVVDTSKLLVLSDGVCLRIPHWTCYSAVSGRDAKGIASVMLFREMYIFREKFGCFSPPLVILYVLITIYHSLVAIGLTHHRASCNVLPNVSM